MVIDPIEWLKVPSPLRTASYYTSSKQPHDHVIGAEKSIHEINSGLWNNYLYLVISNSQFFFAIFHLTIVKELFF